jgi:hypothetical protein
MQRDLQAAKPMQPDGRAAKGVNFFHEAANSYCLAVLGLPPALVRVMKN